MRSIPVALTSALLASCALQATGSAVPLIGETFELKLVTGTWTGDYAGNQSGRSGEIRFTVNANADSAFGSVLLTAPGNDGGLMAADPREVHLLHAPTMQQLHVLWVRIAGGRIRGTIEPYRAPDCNCVVHTVFFGAVVGDTMSGSFTTTLDDHREQTGIWRVARTRN